MSNNAASAPIPASPITPAAIATAPNARTPSVCGGWKTGKPNCCLSNTSTSFSPFRKNSHHPHLHCVIPGGGPSPDYDRRVACRPGFFLPVRVLSQLFRRLFLPALQNAFHPGRLQFFGKLAPLADKSAFLAYLAPWRERDWVVYAKPPFGSPEQVLAYLGRYTHRVAISHQRLLNVKQSEVTFQSKDYRHRHKQKSRRMTLTADEFIRRFLIHTLPPGFQRIRHFGFLANRFRKEKLALCRQLLVIPGTGLLPGPAQCLSFGQTSQASPLPAAPCPQCPDRADDSHRLCARILLAC
jgi:hypothetical protein